MADFRADIADDGADDPIESTVEEIASEVLEEIKHGQFDGDVAATLEKRLTDAGVQLRPEAIDSLAEDIENDASR
jgi:hypothetical protein